MFKKLSQWFEKTPVALPELEAQREIQALRLELAEREQEIARLTSEVQRQRQGAHALLEETVQARSEQWLVTVAAPVAQILTQGYLLETEGKPVQARDVWTVARRIVRTLEEYGLTIEDAPGESVPFDPNCHQVLGTNAAPNPGQMVTVRVAGISYRGKILQKAGVD